MDQRQTQTRLAHARRAGRRRDRDRVDAGLPDHAVQGANTTHDGDVIPDASLVANPDNRGFSRDSNAHDRTVVQRSLVESSSDADSSRADTRRDLAGAAESFRMDVQSTRESRLRKSRGS